MPDTDQTPALSHVTYRHPQNRDPEFLVNGVDIAMAFEAGFTIEVPHADGPAEIPARMFADDFLFEGEAVLRPDLPEAVRQALIAAGWTPPVDEGRQDIEEGKGA